MAFKSFDSLVIEHGKAANIPNSELYDCLVALKPDLLALRSKDDIRENDDDEEDDRSRSRKKKVVKPPNIGPGSIPASPIGVEVRRRCVADLRWLAKYFLWDAMPASDGGTKQVTDSIFLDPQYDAFADLFVKKDSAVPIHKLSSVKTRLLLWPRGGAKSSYDHVDTVQWILAYPSIRILYLTAESSLSAGFMTEIKGFFSIKEDEPSFMNIFWPDHCCLDTEMRKGTLFTTPAFKAKKINRKEATVIASSVGKTKSGWHYEVIKADDAVSDKNTETEAQCLTISQKLFLAENLLVPGGDGYYIDYIGTRYHEVDHYGALLDKYLTTGEIDKTIGRGWEYVHNKTHNVAMLIGKACQIKPDVAEKLAREGRPVTYAEAGASGCDLLLPDIISYSFFMGKFTKNEKTTEGQLNQNPRTDDQVVFDRLTMLKATVDYRQLPRIAPVSQFWDLSFSEKKGADFCVGSSVWWGEEPIIDANSKPTRDTTTVGYIRTIIRDRFNPFSIAKAIVQLAVEERPFVVGIEKAGGSINLEPTLRAEAAKTGDPYIIGLFNSIDWVTPSNEVDAKKIRMGALLPWYQEGRLKIANFCMRPVEKYSNLDILYAEHEKCMTSHHHEDIPDNLGYQVRYAPQGVQILVENNTDLMANSDVLAWSQIFDGDFVVGSGFVDPDTGEILYYTPSPAYDMFEPEPVVEHYTPHGLPNVLGAGIFG